ncbi:RNA cap guanine-N2 methyltransferase,S-adenosyl-L-methionine-dependent methyltransferase [Cinara cedri]|uniref:Trimethylguanosine synthase n=1 Tax=Cinara cedri TaxID=506608 RepID=A0A5E4MUA4_9HEMI|nr:RNA cap guanine-N2 methyltransferase,S-adenosyl-L-methionine-dependent methyltransferase [Cinara cedri]
MITNVNGSDCADFQQDCGRPMSNARRRWHAGLDFNPCALHMPSGASPHLWIGECPADMQGAEVPKRASAANHRVGNTTANQERSTISIDAISCYERLYDLAVRRIVDAEKVIEYLMFMIFKLKLGQAMYEYTLKHLTTNLSTSVKDEKDTTIAGQLFVSIIKSGLVLNDQDYWEPAMKEILNILKNNNSKSTLYILILNFIEGLKRDIGERMQYRSLNQAFRIIEKTINERIRKEKELIEEKAMLKIREEKQSAPPVTVNTIKNYLKTNVKRTAYNRKEAEDYAIRVKSFCCDQTETTAHELDRVKKYWLMRKLLFQRFDCGILLDHESFYSVCPEVLGKHIANRCRFPDGVAVDPFCGAGGNVIQLAATCRKVIAMDIDPIKLKLARHNADIYGCQDRIAFRENDYFGGTAVQTGDVVVTSPPWGGPEYLGREVYSLSSMCEENGGRRSHCAYSENNGTEATSTKDRGQKRDSECSEEDITLVLLKCEFFDRLYFI